MRVINALGGSVKGCRIGVLGLAFKPETDDMRDSPALDILPQLVAAGAAITAYDPAAMDQAWPLLPAGITYENGADACINAADAVVIITEWNEFRALTPAALKEKMRGKTVIDLRNTFDPQQAADAGLDYHNIGRPVPQG